MASISLKKIIRETQSVLKSTKPKGLQKSYWDLLLEQVQSEGTWDEKLMKDIKDKISVSLNKFNKKQLLEIWDQTEISMNNTADEDTLSLSVLKEDISEDVLNSVLDLLDERSFDSVFESRYVENEDSEEDDFNSESFEDFSDESDLDNNEFDDDEKF